MKIILAIVGALFLLCEKSSAQLVNTNQDAGHIDVYITPFYNSEGLAINAGVFSMGLSSTNESQFVATIREMKRKWANLSFVEMYVATIRLYDMGFRKESIYWFYSAQYRGRLFGSLLDEKKIGRLGDTGFELFQANNAFHQLVGPYINSYAGCDLDYWSQIIKRVREEGKQIPDMQSVYPKVMFRDKSQWPKQNDELGEGLDKLLTMLKAEKDEMKLKRIENGTEARFSKLTDKEFPKLSAMDSVEIARLLEHLKNMEKARDIERMESDRESLVRLGCFEHREFQLKFRLLTEKNRKVFSKIVSEASFINDNWALMMTETNSRIISITAHRADVPAWEKLIGQFDSGKLK